VTLGKFLGIIMDALDSFFAGGEGEFAAKV
jgi:hypothetical protein